MATTESFTYPLFTKGQQLKSSDLNNITAYVELEDRLTRAQFIGTGIMNGLDVSWVEDDNGKRLVIGKGAGISSMGYLLYQAEDIAFTKYKETKLSLSKILEGNSLDNFEVWKLTDAGDKKLDAIFPIEDDCDKVACNKCLLALKEINISSTNGGCFNGLETESKKTNFEIAYYLVDQSLLAKLDTLPPAGETKISFKELPSPFLPRLGFELGGLDLTQIRNLTTFKETFTGICQKGIDSLNEAFGALQTAFGKDLDLNKTIKFDTIKVDLETLLAKCAEGNGYKLPYFYEFLEDLVKAYLELVSMGEVSIPYPAVHVEEDWFPHHLLLGGFGNLKSHCRTPKYCANNCTHQPISNAGKARFFYSRLHELLINTSFDELAMTPRIVPGKSYDHALSLRAIPFYYKSAVRPAWNFELYEQDKSHLIPSYFPLPDSGNMLFADPLLYELESWGFFRVEGHANLPLQDAIAKIEAERKRLNLAFDIVCVPLDEQTRKLPSETVFEDLESAFHQLRLEWILDLQTRENKEELLKFLEEMEGKNLGNLDLASLKQLIITDQYPEDECMYKLTNHLYEANMNRASVPVFHEFAEIHPGLEHLGGVQPGGTLVLVYDNPIMSDQPLGGAIEESRAPQVVADFCLPCLCSTKQRRIVQPEIFACFPFEKRCFTDGPQPIITWPSGGRILVRANDHYLPGVAAISPSTGKWNFLPSRLPVSVFDEKGEASVVLSFMHSGKQVDVKTILISRLTPAFEAWASKKNRDNIIQIQVHEIEPQETASSSWISTLLIDGNPLPDHPPVESATPPGTLEFNSKDSPTHVRIELVATNEFGCSANFVVTAPIETQDKEVKNEEKSRTLPKSNPASEKNDSEEPGKPVEPMEDLRDSRDLANGDFEHFDVKELMEKRLDDYKLRYDALLEKSSNKADNIVALRSKLFLFFPPNKATTEMNFRKFSERLLENFSALDSAEQERRKQLLEVLTYSFLDKLYLLGQTDFDATVLPVRDSMELNGINTEAILERWRGDELQTNMSIRRA